MKILFCLTISLYRLFVELVFFISRPLLWLILPLYRYRSALKPPTARKDCPVLIHCASVGEINAISPLIKNLIERGIPVHLSLVTASGLDIARRSFPELVSELAVLDVYSLRTAQLKAISPRLIIIVETEIWPMLLERAAKNEIPIIFINARMSTATYKHYMKANGLIRYLARSVKLVLAQSEDDRMRFVSLFHTESRNAGNLKYCLRLPEYDVHSVLEEYGFATGDRILVWGSSRPGEESLIIPIYGSLKEKFANLKLILAPRHPKRVPEVEKILAGKDYRLLSQELRNTDILLIDSLGQLTKAYAIAEIAIVGGSFYDFGGHNPLEPAFYSKPVVIGKHHHSCKASVKKLSASNAICIADNETLQTELELLLSDENLRIQMGKRAKIVLTENADALENHIQGIDKWLR